MIDRVRTAFAAQLSAKGTCLQEHSHAEFHVHDPHAKREGSGACYIVTTGLLTKADLHIRNSERRSIHFLAIDQCIYDNSNPSKCDCALISGDKIYFIEFKNSENQLDAAVGKANTNPGECLSQLAASIRDFYDRDIIKPGQTVYAIASVGYPRQRPQNGAHHLDQLKSLQEKIQEGNARSIRLRYCSESELAIK
ncbi:hypothetical protein [Hymenobacter elongatus]|uniref:NERD domain-containing protein n=1 Tax=Hymenobacter elongatus TaxID=877208 RepID=A0A4Z0PEW5_9BACT|nr:hypothetical protein [Hymenobacter elongatus]TGE13086.1 hypothetical protein E5J99_19625 [Hymenobacter elongatus]